MAFMAALRQPWLTRCKYRAAAAASCWFAVPLLLLLLLVLVLLLLFGKALPPS
jgi:hypothetical protein